MVIIASASLLRLFDKIEEDTYVLVLLFGFSELGLELATILTYGQA